MLEGRQKGYIRPRHDTSIIVGQEFSLIFERLLAKEKLELELSLSLSLTRSAGPCFLERGGESAKSLRPRPAASGVLAAGDPFLVCGEPLLRCSPKLTRPSGGTDHYCPGREESSMGQDRLNVGTRLVIFEPRTARWPYFDVVVVIQEGKFLND